MTNRYLTQTLSRSDLDSDIQVGTINLIIRLTIRERGTIVDLSTATVKNIIIRNPNNSVSTKTASFVTDGKDGMIQYATIAGDLAVDGTYAVQAYLELPDFEGFSTISSFLVNENL